MAQGRRRWRRRQGGIDPSRLVFLDEIPKGATGKLQRIGLPDKLGLGKAPA